MPINFSFTMTWWYIPIIITLVILIGWRIWKWIYNKTNDNRDTWGLGFFFIEVPIITFWAGLIWGDLLGVIFHQ